MKLIYLNKISSLMLVFGIVLFVASCDDAIDDVIVALPEASFTLEQDGLSVAFSNTSTSAATYTWDFGDGTTDNTESPTHVYGKASAYVVKLTVANINGDEDNSSQALELSFKILVDGDFSDWDDVPVLSERNSDTVGVVSLVKATSDLTYIYFYVEGDDALHGFTQVYINSDGDAATGYQQGGVHPLAGADYELDAGTTPELWSWIDDEVNNPGGLDWNFPDQLGSFDEDSYLPLEKTGNAYEFAILRSDVPGMSSEKVSFAVGDVDTSNDGWEEHGYLPNPGEDYMELELFQ